MSMLILSSVRSVSAEYKKLSDFGQTLYKLAEEYVQNNSTTSSQDVVNYLNSDATKTVFSDALNSGYPKDKVLFEAYQASFGVNPQVEAIVNGLHDVIKSHNTLTDALYYSSWANVGVTGTMMLGLIRWVYVYVRFDKPVLRWIRSQRSNNSLRFTTGGTNTNTHDPNAPLVPEPWW